MASGMQSEFDAPGSGFNNHTAANTSALWAVAEYERPAWHADANCKGAPAGIFFSGQGENAAVARAKEVCAECTVTDECLEQALADGELFGVWGGLSEFERRPIRRERRAAS